MAVAVNSQMAGQVGDVHVDDGAHQIYAFNNVAGTLLVVGCSIADSAGGMTISAVSYGGQPLTKFVEKITGGTAKAVAYLWYILNPLTGSNNVDITPSGTPSGSGYMLSGGLSFTGHDLTTPLINPQTNAASGTSATLSIPGTVAGNIAIDCCCGGNTLSVSLQTLSWLKNQDSNTAGNNAASSYANGGGTISAGYTVASSDNWAMVGAEVTVPITAPIVIAKAIPILRPFPYAPSVFSRGV